MNIPFRVEPLKLSVDRVGPQPPSRSGIGESTLRRCGNDGALSSLAISSPCFLAIIYRSCGTGILRCLATGQDIFLRRSPSQNDQLGLYPFFPFVFHLSPHRQTALSVMCIPAGNLRRFGNDAALFSGSGAIEDITFAAARFCG